MSDEARIDAIVRLAVVPPQPVWRQFMRLMGALGWSGLFAGSGARLTGAIAVAVAVATLLLGFLATSVVAVVAVSPLLLLTSMALVDGVDRVGPLVGLRRSLLFTVAEVTAARAVLFGVAGFVFAGTVAVLAARISGAVDTWDLVAVACAATAVAGVAVLSVVSAGWDRVVIAMPALWLVVVVLPAAVWPKEWEAALRTVPLGGWAVVAVVGVVVFAVLDGRALRSGRMTVRAAGL